MMLTKYLITFITIFGAVTSLIIKNFGIQYDDSSLALAFMVVSWCFSIIIGTVEQIIIAPNLELISTNSYWLAIILGIGVAYIVDILKNKLILRFKHGKSTKF